MRRSLTFRALAASFDKLEVYRKLIGARSLNEALEHAIHAALAAQTKDSK